MENRRVRDGKSFHEFKRQSAVDSFPNDFARQVDQDGQTYFWLPGKFHVVTDVKLAKEVLKNQKFSADRSLFFMSRMPNLDLSLIMDFLTVVKKMMVMSDFKDHSKRRGAATQGFEDHVMEKFKAKVHQTVTTLVESCEENGLIDFVKITHRLPSTVLADLFCIPEQEREEFVDWSIKMTAFFGGGTGYENEDGIRVNTAATQLREYFTELIEKRRSHLSDDYFSSLLKMQKKFELTDEEIVSQAIMMLVAGQVTTSDQMCNNMFQLAQHPQLQKQLHDNPELIPTALEELKRFDPAVTFLFRVASEDLWIGDQLIKKDETVFICSHAINRRGVEKGETIDFNRRAPQSHFAYGHGPHYCLGAKLARMEMQLLFQEILPRFPRLRVKKAERDHYSLSFSGFKTLVLEAL